MGTIVSIGLLAALLLLIATVEVRYKNGSWEINKKTAIPARFKLALSRIKTKLEIKADFERKSPAKLANDSTDSKK